MNQDGFSLTKRINFLQKFFPLSLVLLVVVYQLGPARWIHDSYGHFAHYAMEIVFYATLGPALTYWILQRIKRWQAEKEQAEIQVRSIERRLASITTASADAIVGADTEGRIDFWNIGAELLFGYSANEIRSQHLSVLLGGATSPKVELQWLEEIVQQEGFMRGHETFCRDAKGRSIEVELTATRLHDEWDNYAGISYIMRDITERKRRREEIERLNASLNQQVIERTRELEEKVALLARANADLQKLDQMRSEFVSLVSHQLRAPLTNMNGAVTRIQNDCAIITPGCSRMLNILNQQTMRLERLVNDVLNSTRLESGELKMHLEPVSTMPVVHQVVEQSLAGNSDRPIRVKGKSGLPLVIADRDRVAEILINLLDNADKYSPAGKEVIVDVRADQTEVTISVIDSGAGLSSEEADRVFDKFFRTDNSDSQRAYGYGLGLYVCRLLVELQGGRIWVENNLDGGANFSFSLPVFESRTGFQEDAIAIR